MKVYSPSQTEAFILCQQKRQYYVERWQPKYAYKATVAKWMGTAMAAGFAELNRARKEGGISCLNIETLSAWDKELAAFTNAGGQLSDETHLGLPTLMAKALDHYVAHDPVLSAWEILGVEKEFPEHGNCRPDLIVRTPDGIAPLDYKMKTELYVKYGETIDQARNRASLDWENSRQMWHYCKAIQDTYGELPKWYHIVLGELKPRPKFTLLTYAVDPIDIRWWAKSYQDYWVQMEEIDSFNREPNMNSNCDMKYGRCEYEWACWVAKRDREMMKAKYIQIERRS